MTITTSRKLTFDEYLTYDDVTDANLQLTVDDILNADYEF
jgi:hypothetical protein